MVRHESHNLLVVLEVNVAIARCKACSVMVALHSFRTDAPLIAATIVVADSDLIDEEVDNTSINITATF